MVLERRVTGRHELDVLGQQPRRVLELFRNQTALVAVQHRYWRTPVALPADEPVAQAVGDARLAQSTFLEPGGDRAHRFGILAGRQAVELTRVDHHPVAGERFSKRSGFSPGRADHLADVETELLRELEVALVMRRHGRSEEHTSELQSRG